MMKCVTETQSLLASTPCSHKSHMIALVTVHDFNFQLSMPSLTSCEASWRWQHMQLLHVSAIRNTRATIVTQSQQWKIYETLSDAIAWIIALRARDYEFIHQSPSLCNAIHITGPCLLAIWSLVWEWIQLELFHSANCVFIRTTKPCVQPTLLCDRFVTATRPHAIPVLDGWFDVTF